MTVCWSLHYAGRAEECIRETIRTRSLAPVFHEAGNLLMNLYERAGRFEDAAGVAGEQPIYGIRMDGPALAAAFRDGGADAYWTRRIASLDAVAAQAPPTIHYAYAVVHIQRGEQALAIEHLEQLVASRSGNAVFIAAEPAFRPLHGDPRLPGGPQDTGCAHGFSNAYSVDIVGTSTPARSARRTTDPCSDSTSILLPCDKSISSEDRMVGGGPPRTT